MKTHRLNVLKTKLPDKEAFTIETDPNDLRLHQLCILTAKGGRENGSRLESHKTLQKPRICRSRAHVIDISETAVEQVIQRVAKEKRDWDDFLRQKELYNDRGSGRLKFVSDDDLLQWADCDFFSGRKPVWKYERKVPPRLALVVDDALNSPVMSSKRPGLINLCLRHRHLSCIGLSVMSSSLSSHMSLKVVCLDAFARILRPT
eukprot:6185192-Pleurochrysis_carterae.AAC.1